MTTELLEQTNKPGLVEKYPEPPTVQFNPEADYSWQAKDKFTISGKELEILHNTLGSIFGQHIPPAQMYLMLNECFKISSDVIKRNVENGKISQMTETPSN